MKANVSTQINQAKMTLFFTAKLGLKTWVDVGNLDRELALYKRLSSELAGINFVTYEGKEDLLYSEKLGNIELLNTNWNHRTLLISGQLLKKYYRQLKSSDIFKTNQIPGVEIPLMLNRFFKKKFMLRCGYLHSYVVKNSSNNENEIRAAFQLEKKAFSNADVGIVSTSWQRDWVIDNHMVQADKIKVIPNYVLTDIFFPDPQVQKIYDLIFIGRSGKEKNIDNLLKALLVLKQNGKNISLVLVGSCCKNSKIKEEVSRNGLNVTFKGTIPNFELQKILNQSKVFILPSIYECHPKTLLEAMSCGLPCIGSDNLGIRNDIHHLNNGYLCQTDCISISEAVEHILSDKDLQKELGKNARKYILNNYTLDRIVQLELGIIQEILSK